MGQSAPKIALGFVLMAGFCAARAQSVTEYGSMASKSSTVGRRADSIGEQIGGVWGTLDKTIKSQERGTSQEASPDRTVERPAAQARRRSTRGTRTARTNYEDPSRIQPGLGYEELIRRFGPASFEVSTGPGAKTLAYPAKDGDIDIELLDGNVTKVARMKAQEVAIVRPR